MLYREKETNVAKKLGVSTITLKNWVGLNNFSANINESTMQQQSHRNEDNFYEVAGKNAAINENTSDFYATEVDNITKDTNHSYAHCLHQSIETLALGLHEKIDVLHDTQLDIHHIEIVTDRVFNNIEKLKNEIRASNTYIQAIEYQNKSLEAKFDVLLMQNDTITQKCTQLELLCERFFSKNIELENRLLALDHKLFFSNTSETFPDSNQKTRTTTDLDEKVNDRETTKHIDTSNNANIEENNFIFNEIFESQDKYQPVIEPEINKYSNYEPLQETEDIENFIKDEGHEDYNMLQSLKQRPFAKWLNKVLGLT